MDLAFNIEGAHSLDSSGQVMHIRGWAFDKNGAVFQAMRLCFGKDRVIGYYGISRPDVHGANSGAANSTLFCGFSILTEINRKDIRGRLELQDSDGHWHFLAEIDPASLASEPKNFRPTEVLRPPVPPNRTPIDSRPVLFISHDFASAGAQLLLLRLLRWLAANSTLKIEILIATPRHATLHASEAEKNVLEGFHALGPVHFISDLTQAPENLSSIRSDQYRLIYANTASLGWLLPSLQPFACPLISHVHELGFWMEYRIGLPVFERQSAITDRFIACSSPVRDYLAGNTKAPIEKIEVIHACGSTQRARQVLSTNTRETVRQKLNVPEAAFVMVACGTFDWRKGAELFVPICIALKRRLEGRDMRAFWIGDYGGDFVRNQFMHEVKRAGIENNVTLLGPQKDPLQWMLAADCFALPSREDPFPMVMLEAGTLGLPVVGFEGSGGVSEYASDDSGITVPYLDIEAFAGALAKIASDKNLAKRIGENARTRVADRFDEEISFKRIKELIESLAGSSALHA